MEKEQIKKAEDFLGVKILNPLEENTVVGGLGGHHHHVHYRDHHQDHDPVEQ